MAKTIWYRPCNKTAAQELRKNMTPQEKRLWYDFLKNYPLQFRRQKQFDRFIVDFYCAKAMLVIEIDGSQHYTAQGLAYDKERSDFLQRLGLTVIRFSNDDVNSRFEGVCRAIHQAVQNNIPPGPHQSASPLAFPSGEGGSPRG